MHPKSENHGGWWWHIRKKEDYQMELNADNSVLRAVDFNAKAVKAGGDITGLMSFHFPRGGVHGMLTGSDVIPGFAPKVSDKHDIRHRELLQFFHYQNVFRNPEEIPVVKFSLKIDTLNDARPEDEMFGATITLIEKWKISRLDVADYLASADRNAWAPLSFDPPSLEISNAAYSSGSHGGHGARSNTGMQVQKERTYLVIEPDRSVVAVRPTMMTGYYFQHFELKNYPFDSQVLEVQLKSMRLPKATCIYEKLEEDGRSPIVRHTEWLFRSSSSYATFEPEKKLQDFEMHHASQFSQVPRSSDVSNPIQSLGLTSQDNNPAALVRMQKVRGTGQFVLTVQCRVSRYYTIHLFRVGLVMSLFSLAAVTSMMPHDQSTSMERITLLVTLMLTATTYSLVVAESLPTLPYLTLIDKYVLGTFMYFGIVGFELAVIDWSPELDWPNRNEDGEEIMHTLVSDGEDAATYRATFVNLALWSLGHIAMAIHIVRQMNKFERDIQESLNPEETMHAKFAIDKLRSMMFHRDGHILTEEEKRAVTKKLGVEWKRKVFKGKESVSDFKPSALKVVVKGQGNKVAPALDGKRVVVPSAAPALDGKSIVNSIDPMGGASTSASDATRGSVTLSVAPPPYPSTSTRNDEKLPNTEDPARTSHMGAADALDVNTLLELLDSADNFQTGLDMPNASRRMSIEVHDFTPSPSKEGSGR